MKYINYKIFVVIIGFCSITFLSNAQADSTKVKITKVSFINSDTSRAGIDSTYIIIDFFIADFASCNSITIKIGNTQQLNGNLYVNESLIVKNYKNSVNYLSGNGLNGIVTSSNGKSTVRWKIAKNAVLNATWASVKEISNVGDNYGPVLFQIN